MSGKPLRLALLGCGRAAERIHVPAVQRSKSATLAAVVDVREDRRVEIAARIPGCVPYEHMADALGQAKVDAVIIATPAEYHLDHMQAVAETGLPALLEKPLAPSLEDADLLARHLAHIGGWWVMMAFNRRHWHAAKQLRDIVQSKKAEKRVEVRMILRTDREEWGALADRADVLDDLGCHQLDLLRFVFTDEIASISATWAHSQELVMRVAMQNGVSAHCTAGYSQAFAERMAVQFPDESFTISADSKYVMHEGSTGKRRALATLSDRVFGIVRGRPSVYDVQLDAFCAAIRAQQPGTPDLQDGFAALHAACAARASAESGGDELAVKWK